MFALRQVKIPYYESIGQQHENDSVNQHKFLGEQQFHLYVNVLSQLQNVWVLIWLNLLR